MVFPFDDNSFFVIFFFLGDNIFLAPLVDILQLFAKWAVVEKSGDFYLSYDRYIYEKASGN